MAHWKACTCLYVLKLSFVERSMFMLFVMFVGALFLGIRRGFSGVFSSARTLPFGISSLKTLKLSKQRYVAHKKACARVHVGGGVLMHRVRALPLVRAPACSLCACLSMRVCARTCVHACRCERAPPPHVCGVSCGRAHAHNWSCVRKSSRCVRARARVLA